jgi:hypothetical protein
MTDGYYVVRASKGGDTPLRWYLTLEEAAKYRDDCRSFTPGCEYHVSPARLWKLTRKDA